MYFFPPTPERTDLSFVFDEKDVDISVFFFQLRGGGWVVVWVSEGDEGSFVKLWWPL